MKPLRIIISGGGTGGHVFPAIAIADELKRRNHDTEILFVGALGRMEMERVPKAGYPIEGLPIAGFQRGSIFKNLMLPFRVLGSLYRAYRILCDFKPQVVVGVGGYASAPVLYAAGWLGIPTLIQEQNSFAGITNKILSLRARKVCVAYEGMEKVFPKEKVVLTGNPVRADILEAKCSRIDALAEYGLNPDRKTVLIVGGSLGALSFNKSVAATIGDIKVSHVQFIWQTGKAYYEQYAPLAGDVPNLKALRFVERMDCAYAAADLVVSRAGALAISELQAIGKPALLVPSPNVTDDHQTHNAMALVNRSAAEMMRDADAEAKLIRVAIELVSDEQKLNQLSQNIRAMGVRDAASRIADEILLLLPKA